MKIHQFEHKQWVPIGLDVAWAFFSNPANLQLLTPPWMKMKAALSQEATVVYPGFIHAFHITPPPGLFSHLWVSEITHVEAPTVFIDEQKVGPFAYWHHRHVLSETPKGVDIIDQIHYILPHGWIGELAHSLFLKKQMDATFAYRDKMLTEFFGEI